MVINRNVIKTMFPGRQIKNILTGSQLITIIIIDPRGNSAIVNEKTNKRRLTQDEIDKLETGMIVFDVAHNIETTKDEKEKNSKKRKSNTK